MAKCVENGQPEAGSGPVAAGTGEAQGVGCVPLLAAIGRELAGELGSGDRPAERRQEAPKRRPFIY